MCTVRLPTVGEITSALNEKESCLYEIKYTGVMNGYRQQTIEDRYDTIVIGSGAGGLAAAVLLARYGGQRVLVLERHYVAGGFTQTFRRPGFDWDVGLHYIGLRDEGEQTRRLFDGLTGGGVQWSDLPEVYDRIFI